MQRINKTLKDHLLALLTIGEYFKARRNANKQGTTPFLTEYSSLGNMFAWRDTIDGFDYWKDKATRQYPVNNNWLQHLIKHIILRLPFLLLLLCVSCQKEKPIEPKKQIVYYEVQCQDCLIVLESDKWNSSNELDRSKNQSFNVTGKFKYSFENTSLDSVKFTIYVSALYAAKQQIVARAYTNDGHITELSGWYGFDVNNDYPYSRDGVLKLK